MAAPNYANVLDLKDRLGIPIDDSRESELQQALTAASRWIDRQTARRFYGTASEVRYYSARWDYPGWSGGRGFGGYPWGNPERPNGGGIAGQHIPIDDYITVTEVATDTDGNGSYDAVWAVNTDYWLGPRNATADGLPYRSVNRNQLTGRYIFPPFENAIRITGTAGFSLAVPDEIRQLCVTVAELFARPVLEMSIPGVANYQLGADLKVTMSPEELPPAAQAILRQFSDPVFQV